MSRPGQRAEAVRKIQRLLDSGETRLPKNLWAHDGSKVVFVEKVQMPIREDEVHSLAQDMEEIFLNGNNRST